MTTDLTIEILREIRDGIREMRQEEDVSDLKVRVQRLEEGAGA